MHILDRTARWAAISVTLTASCGDDSATTSTGGGSASSTTATSTSSAGSTTAATTGSGSGSGGEQAGGGGAATTSGPGGSGGSGGSGGDTGSGGGGGEPAGPNFVFVSDAFFDGATLGGVQGADDTCQAEADAAGLAGEFVAWLSTSDVAAPARLAGARGWVRPDGKPVADRVEDLVAGRMFHPIRVDATGADRPDASVITGTLDDGTPSPTNCDDYTSTDGQVSVGLAEATTVWWTNGSSSSCSTPGRQVYCFGIDRSVPVAPTPVAGRNAFVTSPEWFPGGGLASADAFCADEAATASLPGTYRALLATTTASALSRFSVDGDPWVRIDGVPIAATAAGLGGLLDAPIAVGVDGSYIGNSGTWGGAQAIDSLATKSSSCDDWTSTTRGERGESGWPSVTGRFFWDFGSQDCSQPYRLFCLQE